MANVEDTTLSERQKNDRGMLPQFRALEDCVADTLRGTTRNAHSQTASTQHFRGEPDVFFGPQLSGEAFLDHLREQIEAHPIDPTPVSGSGDEEA